MEANLEGNALRILAQAIRGLEISSGLSPALQQLAGNLNHHFDELKPVPEPTQIGNTNRLKRR